MKTTLAGLVLLLFAGTASADSMWNYAGNTQNNPDVYLFKQAGFDPNPCNCSLSGSVTFDDTWQAIRWDFTDGHTTLTQANSTGYFQPFGFGGLGVPFVTWHIVLDALAGDAYLFSENYDNGFEATDGGPGWYVQGNQGAWSSAVSTPEPDTLVLIGVGLAGLLARKRIQARRNQVPKAVWESLG
jgi:PEP-CTERM motif